MVSHSDSNHCFSLFFYIMKVVFLDIMKVDLFTSLLEGLTESAAKDDQKHLSRKNAQTNRGLVGFHGQKQLVFTVRGWIHFKNRAAQEKARHF